MVNHWIEEIKFVKKLEMLDRRGKYPEFPPKWVDSLPNGRVGEYYTTSLQDISEGTPTSLFTLEIAGISSLPKGLSLSRCSGVIFGTPRERGIFSFNVKVSNQDRTQTETKNFTLTIVPPMDLEIIEKGTLIYGIKGIPYAVLIGCSGGVQPYKFDISGTLPDGLKMDDTGIICGTPTKTGTFRFDVTVTDSEEPSPQVVTESFSITIVDTLTNTTTSLPDGGVGVPYVGTLTSAGGISPYDWSIGTGTLPPGLDIEYRVVREYLDDKPYLRKPPEDDIIPDDTI